MGFNCTSCGACCKLIGIAKKQLIKLAKKEEQMNDRELQVYNFPHKIKPNGSCEHLLDNNLCAIYEIRPDICRVDKTWETHYSTVMSKSDYYKKSEAICSDLQCLVNK